MEDAKVSALRSKVAGHKAAIRRERVALARTKAELDQALAQLGIRVVVIGEGEEKTHGRDEGRTRAAP